MKRFAAIGLTFLLLAATGRGASAITFGEVDTDNRFPNVGAIIVTRPSGVPIHVCSGTLIHPKIFLTAGHCTTSLNRALADGVITQDRIRIAFGPDSHDESAWRGVSAIITDPQFGVANDRDIHDIGVLILTDPVDLPCAALADEGLLDDLKVAGVLRTEGVPETFLAVGYGSTLEFPPPGEVFPDGLRRFVAAEYLALENAYLILRQNPAAGSGGVATGDSGGPMFWTAPNGALVLVAINFYGDPERVATGWGYRVDLPGARGFIDFMIEMVEDGLL
jgi:hypothetical protein